MKVALITSLLTLGLTSFGAFAANTHECGTLDSIANLIGNTKTLGNGGVKIAYVSTEEPAAAPDHILVFVYDNEMGSTCTAISRNADGGGFGYVNMKTAKGISYDAKTGVLISVDVTLPNHDGDGKVETLKIRANR